MTSIQDWFHKTIEAVDKMEISDSDKVQILAFIDSMKMPNPKENADFNLQENEKINIDYDEL